MLAGMDKFHRLTWDDVCTDPRLQDLPFKVELNRLNQIVLVPTNPKHSRTQGKIIRLLDRLMEGGESFPELAVDTDDNTKVPDVVWASDKTLEAHRHEPEASWSSAPELCVEVLSPTNTTDEIEGKRALYFERGAQEVWVCGLEGEMTFHGRDDGELARSALCPDFPTRVEI